MIVAAVVYLVALGSVLLAFRRSDQRMLARVPGWVMVVLWLSGLVLAVGRL